MKQFLSELVITDEVKTQISEAFDAQVQEAVEAEKVKLEADMVEKLAEMQENTMAMIEEAVAEEVSVLKEELEAARNLDVTYAEKLAGFKEKFADVMAAKLQEEVEATVKAELDELRESLEVAAASKMNTRIFEAFRSEMAEMFGEEGVDVGALREEVEQLKRDKEQVLRESKINSLLDGITGKKREVLATLLEGVATDKLDEKFERVSSIVLKEEVSEDETLITEGKKEAEVKGTVVIESKIIEEEDNDKWKADFKRRAGIK